MKEVQVAGWRTDWSPKERKEIEAIADDIRQRVSALRAFRQELGISQQELAQILGVTQSNVSKLEAKNEPRLSVLRKMVEHKGGRLKLVVEMHGRQFEWPFSSGE